MQNAELRVALHPNGAVVGARGGEGLQKAPEMQNRNILITPVGVGQRACGRGLVHFSSGVLVGLERLLADLFGLTFKGCFV